jgi:quercetin dioxygenase-like cupin family protein
VDRSRQWLPSPCRVAGQRRPARLELVEVELPAGREVSYPSDAYAFIQQQILMLQGHLRFREGGTDHELDAGDCLQLDPPAPCSFINRTRETCRYLVALTKRRA